MKNRPKTKKQRTLSLVAIALCASLGAGLVPALPVSAKEAKVRSMNLGADGIAGYSSEDGYHTVYLGEFNGDPVPYRVLDADGGNGTAYEDENGPVATDNAMLLLSEYVLENQQYNGTPYRTDGTGLDFYHFGSLSQWLDNNEKAPDKTDTFYKTSFSETERKAILATTKDEAADDVETTDLDYYLHACGLNGDHVFLLSGPEAVNPVYGFSDNDDKTGEESGRMTSMFVNHENSAHWWLRSPYYGLDDNAGFVYSGGAR